MNIAKHLRDNIVPNARNSYRPYALRQRPLALYAGILATVKILTLLSFGSTPQAHAAGVEDAASVIALTNQSRAGYNLQPVRENQLLDAAATKKAADMLAGQYFSHTSPSGVTPWDFIKGAGYQYIIAGENLAVNFYTSDGLEKAWMDSPEHKANILNKDFQDIGVGIAQGQYKGSPAIFVVEMFATPSAQPVAVATAYTSVTHVVAQAKVSLPESKLIALAQPIITEQSYTLSDKSNVFITGTAPSADHVYAIVNNQPVQELSVSQGIFNGTLNLAEGTSSVRVVAYYGKYVSSLSDPVVFNVDTTAPVIANSDLDPQQSLVKVEVQGAPVKVIASIGDNNILLTPTADPNIWQGKFVASGNQLQGNLRIQASDMAGNFSVVNGASLTPNIQANYAFAAQKANSQSNLVYLYFFIGLMVLLGINIAVKREIQHVALIAQASTLAAFAILLFVT